MKRNIKIASLVFTFICLLSATSNSQNTNCNVTVQFTTVTTDVGFTPENVLAVWVENSSGQFIRSLKVMANKRKQYLYTWNDESAGNTVDAVTGATKTSHTAETVTWNGRDVNQTIVPDGNYLIYVEFTEEHAQGPLLIIPFTKDTQNSDSTLNNVTNYTNISIDYAVNTNATGISSLNKNSFSVYPNPFAENTIVKIVADKNSDALLTIYSLNGQLISKLKNIKLSIGENYFELNNESLENNLPNGTYLLRLEYNQEIKVIKLVKQ